jgi:hypothetical protein
LALALGLTAASPLPAQVDQQKADAYFKEAAALCEREGGRLWGVSLCGPMIIADVATKTHTTNQPPPAAPRPPAVGMANAALDWGGTRWSTFAWVFIPADEPARRRLWMHELFHRVQPQLKLLGPDGANPHLDTIDGRYWIQLEWRALTNALAAAGAARADAVRDALAFRAARRAAFPDAAENERRLEINEGLAQYTGTVAASSSPAEATASAIDQLAQITKTETFVRTFPYPSGAAYGLLLDAWAPNWRRQIQVTDDLGSLLMTAAGVQPATDAAAAAARYDGKTLRAAEERRDARQRAIVAELRTRFVDGPVLVLPGTRSASSVSAGQTPIPGAGTVMPSYRTTAEWGTLEAARVLVAPDRSTHTLPAPKSVEGTTITGDGWTLTIAPGWIIRPGPRPGDYQLVKRDFTAGSCECRSPILRAVP